MKDYEQAATDLQVLIDAFGVTMTATPIDRRTNVTNPNDGWLQDARHVRCEFFKPGSQTPMFVTEYSAGRGAVARDLLNRTGSRINGFRRAALQRIVSGRPLTCYDEGIYEDVSKFWRPTTVDVVSSCLLETSALDYDGDFARWASDYGYSSDSISAKQTFEECQRIGRGMKAMFGDRLARALELAYRM